MEIERAFREAVERLYARRSWPRTGWMKFVKVGKTRFRATQDMERSRVTCVSIARVFS
jgi:hypothetical protein